MQKDRIRADPSYCLDQHLFLENPLPCLEVNREFVLGIHGKQWKATLAHRFVELLHQKTMTTTSANGSANTNNNNNNHNNKHKFCRLYTQNIDGLEDQCGLPHSKRIAVHGSMDEAVCAICTQAMPLEQFCHLLRTHIKDITGQDKNAPLHSTPIRCQRCNAPAVKPNIVLFRSSLPKIFFEKMPQDTRDVDLLIIMGTSLGVAPANRYEKQHCSVVTVVVVVEMAPVVLILVCGGEKRSLHVCVHVITPPSLFADCYKLVWSGEFPNRVCVS